MTREEKLERALKVAMRMRRMMNDVGPELKVLLVPRENVQEFDAVIESLKERKTDGN